MFAADSERRVFDALRRHLRDGDAIPSTACGFTDPAQGDIEVDFTVFLEGVGVAVIEVKGGRVSFTNGEWISQSTNGTFTIHPTDQARKCLYALHDYLTRSPTWSRGSLRATLDDRPTRHRHHRRLKARPDATRDRVIGHNHLDEALGRVFDHLNDERNPTSSAPQVGSTARWTSCCAAVNPQRDIVAEAAERDAHVGASPRNKAPSSTLSPATNTSRCAAARAPEVLARRRTGPPLER